MGQQPPFWSEEKELTCVCRVFWKKSSYLIYPYQSRDSHSWSLLPTPMHLCCSQDQELMSLPAWEGLGSMALGISENAFVPSLAFHSAAISWHIPTIISLFHYFHHNYQHPILFYTFNLITLSALDQKVQKGRFHVWFCSPIIKLHLHISNLNNKTKTFMSIISFYNKNHYLLIFIV